MNAATHRTLPQVHIGPGQLAITREPQVFATVLGSCVAVTMFAREHGLAAICHAMLSHPQPAEVTQLCDPRRFRFVSHAVPAMAEAFRRAGIPPRAIEVKLFGGANVIGHAADRLPVALPVGSANLDAARELLQCANLIVRAENTGGTSGRKILFNTATGDVLHRHLHPGMS